MNRKDRIEALYKLAGYTEDDVPPAGPGEMSALAEGAANAYRNTQTEATNEAMSNASSAETQSGMVTPLVAGATGGGVLAAMSARNAFSRAPGSARTRGRMGFGVGTGLALAGGLGAFMMHNAAQKNRLAAQQKAEMARKAGVNAAKFEKAVRQMNAARKPVDRYGRTLL